MKLKKKPLHQQRHQLDGQLKEWGPLKANPRPRLGWLKAIREALGISSQQLGSLLKTNNAGVLRLEEREVKGTASLEIIERAARAMGCRLVYAIVPEESLEKIVDQKAKAAAARLMKSVDHSMRLEKQGVNLSAATQQLETLASELKARLDPSLWEK